MADDIDTIDQSTALAELQAAFAAMPPVNMSPREKLDRGLPLTPAEWEALPQWKKNRTPRPAAAVPAPPHPRKWFESLPDLPPLSGNPIGAQDWRTWFGRAFVVNLDRRPDRMDAFTRGLPADWPLPPVQRIAAVDGTKVPVPSDWKSGPGAYGLYRTYRDILERGITEGWDKPILLFEDDCVFVPGFARLASERLERLPADWDALWLGGQFYNATLPVGTGLVRALRPHRTHSFAVAPRFFGPLLKIWREHWGHVDHAVTRCARKFRIVAFDPPLTAQGGGRSNIAGRTKGREYWDHRTKTLFETA